MYPSFFSLDRPISSFLSFLLNAFIIFFGSLQMDVLTHQGVIEVSLDDSYSGLMKKINHNDFQVPGLLLKSAVVLLDLDHHIKVGEYDFAQGDPVWSLFFKMVTGKARQYPFKIIEGEDKFDVERSLSNSPYLQKTGEILTEGSLLPDTYLFLKGDTDQDVIQRANKAQAEYVDSIWADRDQAVPWKSKREAVIVASMLEKESGAFDERQIITRVIINRLRKNMRLQIDATAIYGLNHIQHVYYKHLTVKNALNTYRMKGLPKHPICMPSRDSLYAALHPKGGHDILYYILMSNGRHHFSKSLAEHRKMKEKIRHAPR